MIKCINTSTMFADQRCNPLKICTKYLKPGRWARGLHDSDP